MKFSCDKYVLQQAAASAARAAAAKSPIPTLEGLLIEAGASVRITGYDLKKAIYTTIDADIPEPGSVLIGARLFCEMLRRMPDGIVTVEAENGQMRQGGVQPRRPERGRLPGSAGRRGGKRRIPPAGPAQEDDQRVLLCREYEREPPGLHGHALRN